MRLSSFFMSFLLIMCGVYDAAHAQIPKEVNLEKGFIYPVDYRPMSLSGNYGELRSNHFHSGVDFRVGGVPGAPVLAANDGYISKISVSPTGYGNALYITHSGGYVTVYGHLNGYAANIQKFVRNKQYEKESFALSIELDSTAFPVTKGELVGYAGNTGSSGGAHLHFEVRNSDNIPLSFLERDYIKVTDKVPPMFRRVEFFGQSQVYGVPVNFKIERPSDQNSVIKVPMFFYVAVDAIDKMEGTNAKLAVNRYKVYLDTTLVYDLSIGEVPFEQGRYINSLIEYSQRKTRGRSMIKSYVEPGNMLSHKIKAENNGIMFLPDTLPHKVKIEVFDYKNNRAAKTYTVMRVDSLYAKQLYSRPQGSYMAWYLANIYEKDGFKITLPPASLYSSIYFRLDTAAVRVTPFAPVWKIHDSNVPMHTPATVYIKYFGPDSLASKALLVSVGANGRLYGAGGSFNNGYIVGKLYSFGNYTIAVDTESPSVVPDFKNGAVLNRNSISFIIKDALSGIGNYRVEIDGHWVVAEFDAKNSRLRVPLQDARIKKGINHKLKITVTDNKENKKVLVRNFKW